MGISMSETNHHNKLLNPKEKKIFIPKAKSEEKSPVI